jgi:hypothetical protein
MKRHRRFISAGLALTTCAVWIVGGLGVSSATTIVAPNSLATVEGNANNGFPFNITEFNLSSQRYQQVFAASEFLSLSGPQLLTQIAFRPDAEGGAAFSSTISSIQINLSTTSAAPDGLSTTFADNVGVDNTVVFSGALSLSSAFTGPAAGPKDFDIVINFQVPFLYDPTAGNLLLDVRNFSGGTTTQFDAEFSGSDPVSRTASISGGVNSPTADFMDTLGLVTQFMTTPAQCALALEARATDGTLTLEFDVGTREPATWNVWLIAQAEVTPVVSAALPVIEPPAEVELNLPFFPALGTVGFLTTLTTPVQGIICSVFVTVDTGLSEVAAATSPQVLQDLLAPSVKGLHDQLLQQHIR